MTALSHQHLSQPVTVPSFQEKSLKAVPTSGYRHALQQLCTAFQQCRPTAIIASEGKCGASYLINHFLSRLEGDVTVVRITEPPSDDMAAMRAVIRGIGFDPTDLSLADLENVLQLYLSFQDRHRTRTILCIEDTQACGQWLLRTVKRVLEMRPEGSRGLMLIMAGRPDVSELLYKGLLQSMESRPDPCIELLPFTLTETRDYLMCRVKSIGMGDIAQVFEFDAITRLHELTGGRTDEVSRVFSACHALGVAANTFPVTTDVVERADSSPKDPKILRPNNDQLAGVPPDPTTRDIGRLMVRNGDGAVTEYRLDRGHVLIGRGKLCDVRIANASVSRHHALVISSPQGAMLVDLESTNGTFVDGQPVKEHALQRSGVITMGECSIDYVGDADIQGWILDVYHSDKGDAELSDPNFATQQLETWHRDRASNDSKDADARIIKGNINNKGDRIYHVPGTSKYDATVIDESKGERWFRSEEEAIAAGWRAPLIK